MSDLSIKADFRETVGTGSARAIRREGKVPCVVYSKGQQGKHISLSARDVDLICHRFDVKTNTVRLEIDGKVQEVLVKQVSLHPVTDQIEHVDFLSIDDATLLRIDVPIKIIGKEKSVEIKRGGVVNMAKRFLTCEVKKDNIPHSIEIDVSGIKMGAPFALKDINLPSGIQLIDKDLNQTILKITGKRSKSMVEEETTAEEGEEGAEENAEENKDTAQDK
ncbi:MAG: 50S ribosomal protein L25/general stress protein Ctc [Alphaproteobacteria bacterium]|nr:50S ribosomal protein L25/general stress protein Ctc [Alphaproteobacteria bacterium]